MPCITVAMVTPSLHATNCHKAGCSLHDISTSQCMFVSENRSLVPDPTHSSSTCQQLINFQTASAYKAHSVYSSHLFFWGGEFPHTKKLTIPPNSSQIMCSKSFFGQRAHTHPHPFNGPLSGTTQVSQLVKPIWILLKQETVSGSGISWAICKSAPCSRQTTTPAPLLSPAAQPTASKHWRLFFLVSAMNYKYITEIFF